ncbi:MAG: BPL-N domain-containing protein [Verrucomicrobiota bacterium]
MNCKLPVLLLALAQTLSALNVRDVAIYNDTDETQWPEGGAWPPLVEATRTLVEAKGYTWEYIDADDVNNNNLSDYYKLIFFPGGWAGGYNEYINQTGYQNIRDFISNGGSYMGMCAGSFFVCDLVYWRENYSEFETPQNIYDYPLDVWPGIADGAILDFQPWDTVGDCFLYPGTRMTDLKVDTNLLPEANPVVNVLYYGGPVFRPPGGKWGDTKVLARYEMDGFSADEFAAMILFPYGSGKVFLSAVHPELSVRDTAGGGCELYYNLTARRFLGQIMDRMLASEQIPTADVAMGKLMRFDTLQGFQYQVQSSPDGENWSDYGQVVNANSFEYSVWIPESDSTLEFRLQLVN